ncbi:MAG: hypothetical protein ACR2JM_08630 [Mycobacterium sp.]
MPNEESPAILTVFRSRLHSDAAAHGYHEPADDMERQARTMPGFLEFKTFTADGAAASTSTPSTGSRSARW